MKKPITVCSPTMAKCMHCSSIENLKVDEIRKPFGDYFLGNEIACGQCQKPIDWWESVRYFISNKIEYLIMPLVGGNITAFEIALRANESLKLDFGSFGVPIDSRIINVNYTPYGNKVFPLESFDRLPLRRMIPHKLDLHGIPYSPNSGGENQVSVFVLWASISVADSLVSLTDAFEAYLRGNNIATVVPANTAVELKLSRLLGNYLQKFVSRRRVSDFLRDAATYAHQLNVVLPAIVGLKDAPCLPDEIRGLLNKLRKLRNEVAHYGVPENPVRDDECADFLCAALFGVYYVDLISSVLLEE